MTATRKLRRQQSGAALLMLMLAVLAATATVLLATLSNSELKTRRLTETRHVLADARQALIEYAVVNPDLDGTKSHSLPCPDIDASGGFLDGESHTSACGSAGESVMGRLPWRTLGIEPKRDASGACLWYAVSGSWKDAAGASSPLINTDSNGQLQLYGIEAATLIQGVAPDDRIVAVVFAGMPPINGQTRPAAGTGCAVGGNAANYLDIDSGSGISNAFLSGSADAIDQFVVAANVNELHNDRIAVITRADLAKRIESRGDFDSKIRALGLAAASCVADYAANNPAGVDDKRLPWAANLAMLDYRPDSAYDDINNGLLSGRLADIVDDSNSTTSNGINRVLSDCSPTAVPAWTPAMAAVWQHWKDHFFYAVANSFSPTSSTPSVCSDCLTVNGSGQYAAVLLFANTRLSTQQRNAPPMDVNTKNVAGNYLEGVNATAVPGVATDFESGPESVTFNDILFCVDDQLITSEC